MSARRIARRARPPPRRLHRHAARGAGRRAAPLHGIPVVPRVPREGDGRLARIRSTSSRCRAPTPETVLGDFDDATFEYAGTVSTFFRDGERFRVRTESADGSPQVYDIAYTYGVTPLQQYLIAFPDGRVQALNICWDTRPAAAGGQPTVVDSAGCRRRSSVRARGSVGPEERWRRCRRTRTVAFSSTAHPRPVSRGWRPCTRELVLGIRARRPSPFSLALAAADGDPV